MSRFNNNSDLSENSERIGVRLMQAEIDLAFAGLRLAMAESEFDSTPRAVEFVERAILAHKTVMRRLATVPAELAAEKRELEGSARRLLEAIVAAERQFQILRGAARRAPRSDTRRRSLSSEAAPVSACRSTKREAC